MLPDDAAHIFAVRSRLAAKARRVGGERDRQPRLIKNFIAIKIRDRNFRRRNQPEIFFAMRHAKKIGGKFRQLPGAIHRFGIHQIRRQNLGVSVLARVQIEHEVHQRPLQLRAQIPVDGEARARSVSPRVPDRECRVRRPGPSAAWE